MPSHALNLALLTMLALAQAANGQFHSLNMCYDIELRTDMSLHFAVYPYEEHDNRNGASRPAMTDD
jgi:hypothetical protein